MRPHPATVAIVAVLPLALLGCSSDTNTDTSAATTDSPPSTSEATGSPAASATPTDTNTDTAQAADLPDPCTLLTPADLAAATGLTFPDGAINEDLSSPERAVCDWVSDDPYATAQTLITPAGDFDAERDLAAQISGDTLDVTVPGANQAYQTPEGSIVAMEVGDLFVQVAYIPSGPGNVNDATLQLAQIAVTNL